MIATRIQPCPELRPYVRQFLVIETDTILASTLVPDTALVMSFRFKGSGQQVLRGKTTSLANFALAGLRDSTRQILHTPGGIMLTQFTETGASAFFREPADSMFNDTVPVDCLLPESKLRPLQNRLIEAPAHGERASAMEDFLLTQLHDPVVDGDVRHAVARLKKANGNIRIEDLAREANLSQSALERKFRRTVGSSPRKLASIFRLRYAIDRYQAGSPLSDVAHEAGYFDQSHFIKDFRGFTDQTPQAFFKTCVFW